MALIDSPEIIEFKKHIQETNNPISFLIDWPKTSKAHLEQLQKMLELFNQSKNTEQYQDFVEQINFHLDKLFRTPLFAAKLIQDNDYLEAIKKISSLFNAYVHAYNETYVFVDAMNEENVVEFLNYLKLNPNKEMRQQVVVSLMGEGKNWREKTLYETLTLEKKTDVINLLSEIQPKTSQFKQWQNKEILKGVNFNFDYEEDIKNYLKDSYGSATQNDYLINKVILFLNKETPLSIRENVINTLINREWTYAEVFSNQTSHLVSCFERTHEYDKWLKLVDKLNTTIEAHNVKEAKDSNHYLYQGSYLERHLVPKDMLEYVIKNGTTDDFKLIQSHINPSNYNFNYGQFGKFNLEHKIEESPLYELVLRGKKFELEGFLKNYEYVDMLHSEYFKNNYWQYNNQKNIILKDELETLINVLSEHQEYSMIDSLKQFKAQFDKPNKKMSVQKIENSFKSKNFIQLILDFFANFNQKKNNPTNPQILDNSLINQVPQNHAEFVQELNQYSKVIQDKFTFLSRKIKISSVIDNAIKQEIVEQIQSISLSATLIEKVLEKEYTVKHVEECVRYKALTGKYFVQAVEQYLSISHELKNELKEQDTSEYLIQFREQVNFIKSSLEEIKDNLKTNRQNELLDNMKSDTQLLRLKQNG